jgi:DNA-binding MarR family transcriptional regulator
MVERTMVAYEQLMQLLVVEEGHDFADVGITMAQAKVLFVLAGGSMHMSDLGTRLRVTPSTTSGLVEKLVEQGLVTRSDDPADRRQVIVSTTTQGLELLERFRELNSRQLRAMLGTLSAADLEIVERSLIILRDATARRRTAAGLPASPNHTTVRIDQGSPT